MRHVLCLAALGVVALPARAADAAAELKKLQGEWVAVSYADGAGEAKPDPKHPHTLTVSKDGFVHVHVLAVVDGVVDGQKTQGKLKLDPSKTPSQIDLVEGKEASPGIYELKGDELTIILAPPGSKRPESFKPEGVQVMYTFKKKKK